MRHGVRLGIDPGDARIGVARSDPTGFLATPLETVRRGKGDLSRIARLVRDAEAVEVVVGLPRSLSGREGPAAVKTREFATRLAARIAPVAVRLQDERLTTVSAEAMLRDRGRRVPNGGPWSTRLRPCSSCSTPWTPSGRPVVRPENPYGERP